MNTLYMKITGFDALTGSVTVAFASDTTQFQDPSKYPSYAFQPANMWPDVTDLNEIKRRIAVAGMWHAEQQERDEKLRANPERLNMFRALVGMEASFAKEELLPPGPTSPAIGIPESNDLVV